MVRAGGRNVKAIVVLEIAPSLDVFYDLEGKANGHGDAAGLSVGEGFSTIRTGSKFRPALRLHPGGKGINVARVLARLPGAGLADVPIELHVFCQASPLTGAVVGWLAAEPKMAGRVRVIHHAVGASAPRVCTNATVTLGGRMAHEFNFSPYMGIREDERARLLDEVRALDRPGTWVVLSGTPPSFGNGADALLYRDLVAAVPRTRVVLDTSGESLDRCLTAGFRHLAMVKINSEEASQSADALEEFRGLTIVTDEGGARLTRGAKRLADARIARPPAVKCTLGAGDSVTAGFLVHYLATGDPPASLRYGEAVALTLVSSPGGIHGITPARVGRQMSRLEA